ncbi:hypothetical protein DPEC_G00334190 [Dallia pectoralis]|uniref:Uncharacterized protein n=1 Tax=Dallia pectoralis TaxID=75939 RepID=A0ACC2F6K1_DALPE|nr:hypothetical protein DPEC_G00334190 [Dallia pectoralis]
MNHYYKAIDIMGCVYSCMKKRRPTVGVEQQKKKRRVLFLSSISPDHSERNVSTTSDQLVLRPHYSIPGLTPETISPVNTPSVVSSFSWERSLNKLDRHHNTSAEVITVVPQPLQDQSSSGSQSFDSEAQGQILPSSQSDTLRSQRRLRWTECRDLVDLEVLGLPNIGNSCFLNATLQSLLYLPVFFQEILRHDNISRLYSTYNLHSCLSEVHYSCQPGSGANEDSKELILRTVKYLLADQDPKYIQDSQQDAHELLVNMLCLLRVEGSVLVELNPGYISPVSHLEFMMASVLSCTSCGRQSSTSELYNHLSLDISPERTLQACLALSFKRCTVDFRCPDCNSLQASKREQFHTLPRVLVLHLKRFGHGLWGVDKQKTPLLIPPQLSLSTLCGDTVPPQQAVERALSPPGQDKDSTLYSSGHYISDVLGANGKWLHCNDSMVSVTSQASVLRSRARSAYLLFYVYRRG